MPPTELTPEKIPHPEEAGTVARRLSSLELGLLAAAGAFVTANAYYIHPIIDPVGAHFEISDAMIGAVPFLNQIALAIGIFLFLPLGDRFSNRRLVLIFVALQALSISIMALSDQFIWFVAGSTLLGAFTIAPYLLPAYASRRVDPSQLGHATAVLTTGVMAGVLSARVGSGLIAEYFGWRTVYYVAAGLMIVTACVLPIIMRKDASAANERTSGSYFSLLGSIPGLVVRHPDALMSGIIQGLSFGIFISIWMGLGLHLVSPEMGYGVDVIGLLALFSILNLFTTPYLGKWADRVGPRRARVAFASVQLAGMFMLWPFGHNLWLLMIPIMFTNVAGPMIDITGRMTFLSEPPDVRTRLMTVFIVCMFTGGGLASWAGTAAYDWLGWTGNALLGITLSALVLILSLIALRWRREKPI